MRLMLRVMVVLVGVITLLISGGMVAGRWQDAPQEYIAFVSSIPRYDVWLMEPDGSHMRRLTNYRGGVAPSVQWSPAGNRLLIFRYPYSIDTVFRSGAEQRELYRGDRPVYADWSPDGKLVVLSADVSSPGMVSSLYNIFILHADGRERWQITDSETYDPSSQWGPDSYMHPSWSPDGEWIAVYRSCCWANGPGIYLMRPDGSDLHQIAPSGFPDDGPIWSPDGQWIAFTCPAENDNQDICYVRPDGSELTRLTDGLHPYQNPIWSPDGKRLAFRDQTVYYIAEIDTNTWGLLDRIASSWNLSSPTWSPDGEWIAFSVTDDRQYKYTIYRVRWDGTDQQQITVDSMDAAYPVWSPPMKTPFRGGMAIGAGVALVLIGIAPWSRVA